jgi:uncharacterized repeat protein (TIGR03837 family)
MRNWDIFCSVVDNYGDIGVCWRLARQLSCELQQCVRLWVDDLASFRRLCASVNPALESQRIDGVEVRHWRSALPPVAPADVVVEGFGVRVPDSYIAAMAECTPRPVWINLEHLSAEAWVEGCHGLPSPHPHLPLVKYFFFPGFTAATGGLLIERGFAHTRDVFQADVEARDRFWQALGVAPTADAGPRISLFSYENAALSALIAVWSAGREPVTCIVPEGRALTQLAGIVRKSLEPGSRLVQGRLTIHAVPFLDLDQYDRLLWACDINFVRGEDSFVRAQLAARPQVWQAYVQNDDAHLAKLAAFLDRYTDGLDAGTAAVVRSLHEAWNRQTPDVAQCWEALVTRRTAARAHARIWSDQLASGGNLAIKLAEFCRDRLE